MLPALYHPLEHKTPTSPRSTPLTGSLPSSAHCSNQTAPQYVGSDLHFSNGAEVASFNWTGRPGHRTQATWKVDAGKTLRGAYHIWVSLPGATEVERPEGCVRVEGCVWKVPLLRRGESGRVFDVQVEYVWLA